MKWIKRRHRPILCRPPIHLPVTLRHVIILSVGGQMINDTAKTVTETVYCNGSRLYEIATTDSHIINKLISIGFDCYDGLALCSKTISRNGADNYRKRIKSCGLKIETTWENGRRKS